MNLQFKDYWHTEGKGYAIHWYKPEYLAGNWPYSLNPDFKFKFDFQESYALFIIEREKELDEKSGVKTLYACDLWPELFES